MILILNMITIRKRDSSKNRASYAPTLIFLFLAWFVLLQDTCQENCSYISC